MEVARRDGDGMRPELVARSIDDAIVALAIRQHGVVATRQLVRLGLTRRAVSHRAAVGRLHRIHRGVYAVGHPVLGPDGRRMAAVLAAGPRAVLSHASAGALWELRPSAAAKTDVTVPTAGGRAQRAGIRIHRVPGLAPGEATTLRGIPVTTPARTILDLAAMLQPRRLERVLDEAEQRELVDVPSLEALARARAGHRGAPRLLRVLAAHAPGTTPTRGELEERFLALCDAHGFERPRVNSDATGREVDFLFPAAGLIVETDSYRHHRTRAAFERDRVRDAIHAAAGYRTLRFTYRQVTDDPDIVAAALRTALGVREAA
jgi:hypothetical protein